MTFKSGFIALVGMPNVGKSTLMNRIFKQKIAIVSDKPQTTRNSIRGVLTTADSQLVFIDTPGIHEPKDEMGRYLNRESLSQLEGVDVIYFIVDATTTFRKQEQRLLERFQKEEAPLFLIVNKIDKISKSKLLEQLTFYSSLANFAEIIPISAQNDDNIDHLLEVTKSYLDEGPAFFEEDRVVDYQRSFLLSEIIREKVLYFTEKEVPHDVACVIEDVQETDDLISVMALLLVQNESQKPILIGKQGSMIKKIRQQAKRDIQREFNKPVELEIFVRVEKDWRSKQSKLKDLGYTDE